MKSLSFKELDLTVDQINLYAGAILEDAIFNNDVLLLLFKSQQNKAALIIDVRPKPFLMVSAGSVPGIKKQTKPIVLFLKAHFLGATLDSVEVKKELGRLVVLKFSGLRTMELHLFSQARNIILYSAQAQISLKKLVNVQTMGEVREDLAPRTPGEIFEEWVGEFQKPKKINETASYDLEKALNKKKQGLVDLVKKKNEFLDSLWFQVSSWLAQNRSLEVPHDFTDCIDQSKDLNWNIERAFTKTKQIKEKIKAIERRIIDLQSEIANFTNNPSPVKSQVKADKTAIDGAKGRTKIINDRVRAFIGKSAEDNLKILRKSKAWHLWLHIKDVPRSDGIIAFDQSVKVPLEIVREVALWVVEQSLSAKQRESWKGVKSEVIYCECRFVTPIRGDKLGRVNYKNEKTITVIS